jgi:hypothetical protein
MGFANFALAQLLVLLRGYVSLRGTCLDIINCKKYRAKRSCDNHVMYQLKLRSLRDTLGVILGLYIYIRSG